MPMKMKISYQLLISALKKKMGVTVAGKILLSIFHLVILYHSEQRIFTPDEARPGSVA